MDYPNLTAAIAKVKETRQVLHVAKGAGAAEANPRTARMVRHAYYENEEAQSAAYEAYVEELLPAILPGTRWERTPGTLWGEWESSHPNSALQNMPVLFSHRDTYRLHGTAVMRTWQNCLLIGHPHAAMDKDGLITREAAAAAATLADMGVGVWVRPDLSAYDPDKSQLVLASPLLTARYAEQFGFRKIWAP